MKINYFSDIHLEFGPVEQPDNDADLIIAAGDIGLFIQGLEWLKSLNKVVIYVLGNHEFYNTEYHNTLSILKHLCKETSICLLEKRVLEINDCRFIGCSLWADLFVEGEEKARELGSSLNDFRKISFNQENFNENHFSQLHKESKTWLEKELEKPYEGKTIIVTHHAPTEWSWNDSHQSIKKLAYCNDLKYLFHTYEIDAWFHGHVHSTGDYRIAGARILSNPRGYFPRKLVDTFDINKMVEI